MLKRVWRGEGVSGRCVSRQSTPDRKGDDAGAGAGDLGFLDGADAHPLYQWLTAEAPGILGSKAIKWNFTKFLVDRDGAIVARYGPRVTPEELGVALAGLL